MASPEESSFPDIIPVAADAVEFVPEQALQPAEEVIAVETPAGEDPYAYLKSLPRDKIRAYAREARDRGESLTPYVQAANTRAREGNLFGDEDRSGETPDSPLIFKNFELLGRGAKALNQFAEGVFKVADNLTRAAGKGIVSGISLPPRYAIDPATGKEFLNADQQKAESERLVNETMSAVQVGTAQSLADLRQAANNLANWAYRSRGEQTPEDEKAFTEQFMEDIAVDDFVDSASKGQELTAAAQGLRRGEGDVGLTPEAEARRDAAFERNTATQIAAQAATVDPENVTQMAPAADLSNLVPFERAFSVVSAASKGKKAATVLEQAAKPGVLASGLSKTAKSVSNAFRAAEKTVETSPLIGGISMATAASMAGADAGVALLSGLLGANTRRIGVARATLGKVAASADRFSEKLLGQIPPGPMGAFAVSAARAVEPAFRGAVAAQLANTPFLLGSQSEEEFADAFAGAAALGAAGGMSAKVVNGLNAAQGYFLANKNTIPEARVPAKNLGVDPALDAAHLKVLGTLNNASHNLVELWRQNFKKQGKGEAYTLLTPDYESALDRVVGQTFVDESGRTGTVTPEWVAAAKRQAGVTLSLVDPATKQPRRVQFTKVSPSTPGVAFGHELGELLWLDLSPEERAAWTNQVRKSYSPEDFEAYRQKHEDLVNRDAAPGETLFPLFDEDVARETFAEHASAVLNSIPVGEFSPGKSPKELARLTYGLVGRTLEKLGAKQPKMVGGDESGSTPLTGLSMEPSFKLAGMVENFLKARELDGLSPKTADAGAQPPPLSSVKGGAGQPAAAPAPKPAIQPWQRTLSGTPPVAPATPTATAPTPTPVAPAPVAAQTPNLRATGEQQENFTTTASPEVVKQNVAALQADENLPRKDRKPVETDYFAAKSPVASPDQVVRELQRRAADAAEKDGAPNPLRQLFQKIFVPYGPVRTSKAGKPTVFGMSLDKVIQNVDLLQGWLRLNPNGPDAAVVRGYLGSPDLVVDLQDGLRNQSNGYGFDGRKLTLPADARDITPSDPNYTPVRIPTARAQVLNMLMGMEQPQKETPGQAFARRFAEQNGTVVTEINGVSETNPLRARLRAQGFDPRILNAVVENLRVDRMATQLKPRPDLNFSAGDTGIQRAGFMPASAQKAKSLSAPEALELGKTVAGWLLPDGSSVFGNFSYMHEELAKARGFASIDALNTAGGNRIVLGPDGSGQHAGEIILGVDRLADLPDRQRRAVERLARENDLAVTLDTGRRASFMPAPQDKKARPINEDTRKIAADYMAKAGFDREQHTTYVPLDEPRMKRIADWFETAKHEPLNPKVEAAYRSLADETKAQYQSMVDAGIQIEPFTGEGEPYASSAEMMKDVRDNKHLYFLKTENAFGEGADAAANPLLEPSGIEAADGTPLLMNDLFRAVHDFFGHTAEGFEFGPRGEFNAYLAHSRMFSDQAKPALAAETLTQNAWVNFGQHLRRPDGSLPKAGEPGYVSPRERRFADQKTTIVPDEILREVDASVAPETPARFMPAPKDGFYSQLEKTLEAIPPKATRQQIEAALRDGVKEKGQLKARPVKAEEMADVKDLAGVSFSEWLKDHPDASREEMLDFVRGNRVEVSVREVIEDTPIDPDDEDAPSVQSPKYEQYTLPGGDNYREVLLTAPDVRYTSPHFSGSKGYVAHYRATDRMTPNGEKVTFAEEVQSDLHQEGRKSGYRERIKTEPVATYEDIVEGDQILGRYKVQWVAPGAEWFRVSGPAPMYSFRRLERTDFNPTDVVRAADWLALERANDGKVADAPFKKSWPEQVFKHLLTDAVEAGSDWVAWTTGKQQSDMYDLRKQVSEVQYKKEPSGTYKVRVVDLSGGTAFRKEGMPLAELEGLLGKDISQRISADSGVSPSPGDAWKQISGEGLAIGGEGMKKFYDEILPSVVDKYLKKFGVRTEQVPVVAGESQIKYRVRQYRNSYSGERYFGLEDIDTGKVAADTYATWDEANEASWAKRKPAETTEVHAVRVTPEMRETILEEGQPRFMPAAAPKLGKKRTDEFGDTVYPVLKGKQELGTIEPDYANGGFRALAIDREDLGTAETPAEAVKFFSGYTPAEKAPLASATVAAPKAGKLATASVERLTPTGWVLPDGSYAGISADNNPNFMNRGDFHGGWLADRAQDMEDRFGLKLGKAEDIRFAALNKGFIRVRLDGQTGRMGIEANPKFLKGDRLQKLQDVIEANANRIGRLDVNLFNDKGTVLDSGSLDLFRIEDPKERDEKVLDLLQPRASARFMPAPEKKSTSSDLGLVRIPGGLERAESMLPGVDELLLRRKGDVLEIADIEVVPSFRSRGVGARQVQAVENWATKNGFKSLEADSVADAIPFWEKQGFTPVDGEESAFGEGGQVMSKPLSTSARFMPSVENKATFEDFKPENLKDLLSKKDWTIFTAANPNAVRLTDAENAARMALLKADLDEIGAEYLDAIGKYGNEEPSLIVTNISPEDTLRLTKKYEQAAAVLPEGMTYPDGSYNPATGSITVHETAPEDFYTYVPSLGSFFTVDIDFNKTEKPAKASTAEPKVKSEKIRSPLEAEDDVAAVSSRLPTAKKATEDGLAQRLTIRAADVLADSENVTTIGNLLKKYPGFPTKGKARELIKQLHDTSVENLLWLHDKMPKEIRDRSKLWYDGGRKLVERWSEEHQISRPAVAGVLASLSPQKDWFMNVDLARRVIEHRKELQDKELTDGVVEWFDAKFGDKAPENVEVLRDGVGKKFSELSPYQRAVFLRAFDEITSPRTYQIITPEGNFSGPARKMDGGLSKVAWGDFGTIAKAIAILEDPSRANISARLGFEHKVRSFNNNLLVPNESEARDVTIDTHAVAAALLRPLAGGDTPVLHNFGGARAPGSAFTGASGLYGLYADAYREAADARGLLPREMQSITWEAVRALFTPEFKTETNKAAVDAIWNQYRDKKITLDEARNQIFTLAGGINAPAWALPSP